MDKEEEKTSDQIGRGAKTGPSTYDQRETPIYHSRGENRDNMYEKLVEKMFWSKHMS